MNPAQTKDVMTKKVISIPFGRSLAEAVEVMQELRIRHLPVVDRVGKIVGVLAEKDYSHLKDLSEHKVETFMSVPVEWVSKDMLLRDAIRKMIEKKITSLLIGDGIGQVDGIITSEDLMWFLANRLEKDEKKHSPLTLFDVQSLEEIANQISMTGL